MDNLFDLNARFREREKERYMLINLEMYLHERMNKDPRKKLNQIRQLCRKTFSSCAEKDLRYMTDKDKFQYLKFLQYIFLKEHQCKLNGFSLFSCIERPSERYLDFYTDVVFDIHHLVSPKVLEEIDKIDKNSQEKSASAFSGKEGKYADSIHTIQQNIDLLAISLRILYGNAFDSLYVALEQLNKNIRCYEKAESYYWSSSLTYWDELYIRICYARNFYWELDLLSAYQKILTITSAPLSKENALYAMMDPNRSQIVPTDQCTLIYNNGKIEEILRAYPKIKNRV